MTLLETIRLLDAPYVVWLTRSEFAAVGTTVEYLRGGAFIGRIRVRYRPVKWEESGYDSYEPGFLAGAAKALLLSQSGLMRATEAEIDAMLQGVGT